MKFTSREKREIFVIEGRQPLWGEVEISSSKNAVLKMIAASLLSEKPSTILKAPKILDLETMVNIVRGLGGKVIKEKSSLMINPSGIKKYQPDVRLVKLLRASIVFVGPLLARFGKAIISQPGGDIIGARPIDTHIRAFQQLGVRVNAKDGFYHFTADKASGKTVILDEMSVSATENILMYATLLSGETEIRVAAAEPEIADLANFLNKMGAKITGAGTHVIKIKGVKKLKGISYQPIPDRIEAGTFIIAAALSGKEVFIKNVRLDHLDLFLKKLQNTNVNFSPLENGLVVRTSTFLKPLNVDTRPYPGFSTDLQAPLAVLLTQVKGTSLIFESLYENRFNYAKELSKMGASVEILDPHRLMINGPTPLFGKKIRSYDIRAGATLVIAALIASGKSEINNVELIDRGYEKIDQKLKKLHAKIKRIK